MIAGSNSASGLAAGAAGAGAAGAGAAGAGVRPNSLFPKSLSPCRFFAPCALFFSYSASLSAGVYGSPVAGLVCGASFKNSFDNMILFL